MSPSTVNLGIVAHVDAGKTSLTERLLFDTGVIDHLGSVDAGTTQTDSGEIERRRGITIRSAVASFRVGGRQVNLIDTPGHSDFVAEVERALSVLDAAVLVVSAVEGVQPHTRLLMRTLRALRLPTVIFVNKIDRRGARAEELLADLARLLTPALVPLGQVTAVGTQLASFKPHPVSRQAAEILADHDDDLLSALVDGVVPSPAHLAQALRTQIAAAQVHPVLFGSALSGAGVPELLEVIGTLLPGSPCSSSEGEGLRARVFAIERTGQGRKVAYVRSYSGELRSRQRVAVHRRDPDGPFRSYRAQVTELQVVGGGSGPLTAGRIGRVAGLGEVRIGDQLGSPAGLEAQPLFPPPSLETVVTARDPAQTSALHAALLRLAEEDPLIRAQVTSAGESSVLLYGEVQKEVIAATLAEVHGIPVDFAPTRIVHLERPVGVGSSVELIGHGFAATVGLRVEPGVGVDYRLEVELGSLPLAFHRAIEETVRQSLEQGRYGWPVTDIRVTLTHSGYWSPISVAGDFRDATPLVLMAALAQARTAVFEPCHRFELEVPSSTLGPVTTALARLEARIESTVDSGAVWRLTGELPARCVRELQQRLPGLSHGEGLWASTSAGDRPVMGRPPTRPRTDGNPFDRAEYTRYLAQRQLGTTTASARRDRP